jgi:hypothetical protein
MTLDCVKNVSSLRERNSSQGSFLFYRWKPPKHGFEGLFVFLLHDAVNQLAGLSKLLHHFAEILLHIGYKLLSFHLTDAALCLGILDKPEKLLHDPVIQVAGFSEILLNFLEILLHIGNKLLSFIWQTRPSAWAKLIWRNQISSPM